MATEIYKNRAIEKIKGAKITGNKEKIMEKSVKEAMTLFCGQSEEFSQAVVQGGNFEDCMKAIAKNAGNGISDFDAFSRAVKFYFPTATIHFAMTIDIEGDNALGETPANMGASAIGTALSMSLDDLLGM